ncbi:hypothetical protein HHI36_002769, partial [Cryptolaemus montrouzieri]
GLIKGGKSYLKFLKAKKSPNESLTLISNYTTQSKIIQEQHNNLNKHSGNIRARAKSEGQQTKTKKFSKTKKLVTLETVDDTEWETKFTAVYSRQLLKKSVLYWYGTGINYCAIEEWEASRRAYSDEAKGAHRRSYPRRRFLNGGEKYTVMNVINV